MQQETTEGIHTRQRLRAVPKKQGETLVLGTEMRSVCLEISNTGAISRDLDAARPSRSLS